MPVNDTNNPETAYLAPLEQALARTHQWQNHALALFKKTLLDDELLLTAFKSRESLIKKDESFPTLETTISELHQALTALEQDDTSIYMRNKRDNGRSLQISEEIDEQQQPRYPRIFAISAHMPLSLKLRYDAACFHSCMMSIYVDKAGAGPSFIALGEQFPDAVEEIAIAQRALEPVIKALLANEMLQLEYKRVIDLINDDVTISREAIITDELFATTIEQATAEEIANKINALHLFYQQQKQESAQLLAQYQQGKNELIQLLAVPGLPSTHALSLQEYLGTLLAAEKNQSLCSIAQQQAQATFQLINQMRFDMEHLRQSCNTAQELLNEVLARTEIDKALKQSGHELVQKYDSVKKTMPLDQLHNLALQLAVERDAILTKHELQIVQRDYNEATQQLNRRLSYKCIPEPLKNEAQALISPYVQKININQARTLTKTMRRTSQRLDTALDLIRRQCQQQQQELSGLFKMPELNVRDLELAEQLLERYQQANEPDEQWDIAQQMKAESSRLFLHAMTHRLANEYNLSKSQLEALISDDYIPARIKSSAERLVSSPFNPGSHDDARTVIALFNQEINNINRAVEQIKNQCSNVMSQQRHYLSRPDIRDSLKEPVRQLFSQYDQGIANNEPLAQTERLVAQIERACLAMVEQEPLLREREGLQRLLDDVIIPEKYKVSVRPSLANPHTSRQQIRTLRTGIEAQITALHKRCTHAVSSLNLILNDNAYAAAFKSRGQQLINEYQVLAANGQTPLDDLGIYAELMLKQCELIVKKQQMKAIYFSTLIQHIMIMSQYGVVLAKEDKNKSQAVAGLVGKLNDLIDGFVERSSVQRTTAVDAAQFKRGFKKVLHEQDHVMNSHRHLWKPIVANLLIALTGIGLLALIGHAIYHAVQHGGKATVNHSLFFAKTASQQCIDTLDAETNRVAERMLFATTNI
ncbi:MAG: hypothetical protein ACRC0B_01565 [Legionella sp.]